MTTISNKSRFEHPCFNLCLEDGITNCDAVELGECAHKSHRASFHWHTCTDGALDPMCQLYLSGALDDRDIQDVMRNM